MQSLLAHAQWPLEDQEAFFSFLAECAAVSYAPNRTSVRHKHKLLVRGEQWLNRLIKIKKQRAKKEVAI
jgi:hypothetical protein